MTHPATLVDATLTRGRLLGLAALAAIGAPLLAGCDESNDALRVMYAPWVRPLHPAIAGSVDRVFAVEDPLEVTPSPPDDFALADLGRDPGHAPWDVYVGLTPFADLGGLVKRKAVIPWDGVVPRSAIADLHPRVREECSVDGRLYSWPFVLDIVILGWNGELVERAGLDPTRAPASWDEVIANARQVVRTGAAPFGCTFDPRPWRSLVPIAYSLGADVTTPEGLIDLRNEAVVGALEILKQLHEVANPDVLDSRTTPGVGSTPDEGAFAAQTAAYYLKYQNAPIRLAGTWPEPSRLALAPLPSATGAPAATVFWSSGAVRLRDRKATEAAGYVTALSSSEPVWRSSLGGGRAAAGQLPAQLALWRGWREAPPAWLPVWAPALFAELDRARPIPTHRLGATQFTIAQPWIERALTGDEAPRRALAAAMALVNAAAATG